MTGGGRSSARSRVKSKSAVGDDTPSQSLLDFKSSRRLRRGNSNREESLLRIFDINPAVLVGFGCISLIIVFFVIRHLMIPFEELQKRPRVITPFPAPKVMDLPQFQGDHKESLYWGTYRPQVYFGVRARTPKSLVAGLMWLGIKDGRYSMRHICQNSDELKTYGWTHHNGRDYGHQNLVDQEMALMTSFLKSKEEGSGYGGDWAVRIDARNEESEIRESASRVAHLFFYLAEEEGSPINLWGNSPYNQDNSLVASGSRKDIGSWQLHLESKDNLEVHYSGFRTPHIHNLTDLVQHNLGVQARKLDRLQLSDTSEESSNVLVFQVSVRLPFRIDMAFVSGTDLEGSRLTERVNHLSGASLTSRLDEKQKEFDTKFKTCFNLSDEFGSESISVGKAAISNLFGGIGYFYGQSKISVPTNPNLKNGQNLLYWPAELYSAVPSRPFFPRGFLWDEGFHDLVIWRWDLRICLDIIGHWIDLMNIDGWIPREQILGAEALSKVPEEYVVQHPSNGNPPTLFLVLRDFVCGMKKGRFTIEESEEISSFLERAFIRFHGWFQWFNTTQSGKEAGSYFWHGRDSTTIRELNPKTLTSGLDDYPRSSHPNEDERHVDLRCWMLLAADCMHSISKLLKKGDKMEKDYGSMAKLLSDFDILNQMHFDHASGAYSDFGNHTEKVRLRWQEVVGSNNYINRELIREVLEDPKLRFVPHVGYVSLFPFIARIIPPESQILEQQLNLISNKSIMWTEFGLRSLSKSSSMYMKHNTEHDAPYWRGPIWMNINYLVLSSLHHYSKEDGPYRDKARDIYNNLRRNLIRNVVQNHQQTGFFWEQYEQKKGKGKGARVFTGWTSLVLLIMAEAYTE
ncbi:mannosyl-oligosaccharide glucosidase GCS1-like [Impatiens glandulifera]|uniref:mannosyl-oligosaccharide glucosidase GCS1-like n=1 Tax=Impatiens glandulifera TaxID=253017 RepID=UPI001FB15B1E|nr:mannosyl-oligosaccharide glucosidase GCS1-like [Impatiens glandulifera]